MATPLSIVSAEQCDDGQIVSGAGELLLDLKVDAWGDDGGAASPPFGRFGRFALESSGLDFECTGLLDWLSEEVGFEHGVEVGGQDAAAVDEPNVF